MAVSGKYGLLFNKSICATGAGRAQGHRTVGVAQVAGTDLDSVRTEGNSAGRGGAQTQGVAHAGSCSIQIVSGVTTLVGQLLVLVSPYQIVTDLRSDFTIGNGDRNHRNGVVGVGQCVVLTTGVEGDHIIVTGTEGGNLGISMTGFDLFRIAVSAVAAGVNEIAIGLNTVVIVTQSGGLVGNVAITAGCAGVGGVTTGGAGCRGDNRVVLMTQSCGLVGNIAVTAGCAGVGGVTIGSAGGGYGNMVIVMTQSRDHFNMGFTANGAGGGDGSVGGASSLYSYGFVAMTECGDHFIDYMITCGTGIAGITFFGAGCGYRSDFVIVAQSGDHFNMGFTANSAGGSNRTAMLTISCHGYDLMVVAQCRGFVGNIALTAMAGISGEATGGAGGGGNNSLIAVAQGFDLAGNRVLTTGNTNFGDVAVVGAGGINGYNFNFVTQSYSFVCNIAMATGAGVGSIAGIGAGGSGGDCFVAVTQCFDGLSIGITAGAGVNHGTGIFAGSMDGGSGVNMTDSGDHVTNIAIATSASVSGVASGGAGGSGGNCLVVMTQCAQGFGVAMVTSSAGISNGTGILAGSLNSFGNVIMAAVGEDGFGVAVAATGAGVGHITVIHTGGVYGIGNFVSMCADFGNGFIYFVEGNGGATAATGETGAAAMVQIVATNLQLAGAIGNGRTGGRDAQSAGGRRTGSAAAGGTDIQIAASCFVIELAIGVSPDHAIGHIRSDRTIGNGNRSAADGRTGSQGVVGSNNNIGLTIHKGGDGVVANAICHLFGVSVSAQCASVTGYGAGTTGNNFGAVVVTGSGNDGSFDFAAIGAGVSDITISIAGGLNDIAYDPFVAGSELALDGISGGNRAAGVVAADADRIRVDNDHGTVTVLDVAGVHISKVNGTFATTLGSQSATVGNKVNTCVRTIFAGVVMSPQIDDIVTLADFVQRIHPGCTTGVVVAACVDGHVAHHENDLGAVSSSGPCLEGGRCGGCVGGGGHIVLIHSVDIVVIALVNLTSVGVGIHIAAVGAHIGIVSSICKVGLRIGVNRVDITGDRCQRATVLVIDVVTAKNHKSRFVCKTLQQRFEVGRGTVQIGGEEDHIFGVCVTCSKDIRSREH